MTSDREQSAAAAAIPDTVRNYVGGDWVSVTSNTNEPVVDPATGKTLVEVPFTEPSGIDAAVGTANEAFGEWRRTPPVERVQYLYELKQELEQREDRIANALSQEHGKTLDEAYGEIRRGIENVEVATGIPNMLREGSGVVEDIAPAVDERAVRRPLGTFTAITPFNFPAMIPLWFLPYAVATGNTFVHKPSEKVPITSQIIFKAIDAVNFPDGVVNLVNGGADTVNALLTHDGITGVSFVGSTPIARHVYETAAENGKRVQAQGGAKNYAVVTDAAELDEAVPNIVGSVYGNAGQRCLANDVVVGVGDVYSDLRAALLEEIDSLVPGNGLDEATDVCPLITEESRNRVAEMIEDAAQQGAQVVVDGRGFEHPDYPDGHFLGPTLLEGVTADMDITQTEIFGPVLCLAEQPSLDDAIEMVNSTEYGNASSIFTEDGREARQYRYEVDAGNIGVNVGVCAPMGFFHFGGTKASFFGDLHAQGEDAVAFYTDKRIEIERWYGTDSR